MLALRLEFNLQLRNSGEINLQVGTDGLDLVQFRLFELNDILASLQAYAATKENQIREVCSTNYQAFVDSIEEVVRMKSDVATLQKDIEKFQTELIGASSSVLSSYDSLEACYNVQQNIDESIEKLKQCQRIVSVV
jgi:superfamily I DNA and/or RNA helicase